MVHLLVPIIYEGDETKNLHQPELWANFFKKDALIALEAYRDALQADISILEDHSKEHITKNDRLEQIKMYIKTVEFMAEEDYFNVLGLFLTTPSNLYSVILSPYYYPKVRLPTNNFVFFSQPITGDRNTRISTKLEREELLPPGVVAPSSQDSLLTASFLNRSWSYRENVILIFLAVLNIYCKANNISTQNFGDIIGNLDPTLSQRLMHEVLLPTLNYFGFMLDATLNDNLAGALSIGLSAGNYVEEIIFDFFNTHQDKFGLSRPLNTVDLAAVQKRFEQAYHTLFKSSECIHDNFIILDKAASGEKAKYVIHQGAICVNIAEIMSLFKFIDSYYTDFYARILTDFREHPIEIPDTNSSINDGFVIEPEKRYEECSVDEFLGLPSKVKELIHDLPLCKLLHHVVQGSQDEAEDLLSANTNQAQVLLQTKGLVTDYSGRTFRCTAYEYAYWAKDIYMCRMLETYMDKNTSALMLAHIETMETNGLAYQQQGQTFQTSHFDMAPLITALQQYNSMDKNRKTPSMLQNIRNAQLGVPAHVANEYCRLDRSFVPTPDFREATLPRRLVVAAGCYLHIRPEVIDENTYWLSRLKEKFYIESDRNIYWLSELNNLYYTNSDGKDKPIEQDNFARFAEALQSLEKDNETHRVFLSSYWIKRHITYNGGNHPDFKADKNNLSFFFDSKEVHCNEAPIIRSSSVDGPWRDPWPDVSHDLQALITLDEVRTAEIQQLRANLVNQAQEACSPSKGLPITTVNAPEKGYEECTIDAFACWPDKIKDFYRDVPLFQFLHLVAQGHQDEAEKLLTANPSQTQVLLHARGLFTDYSGRTFKCSAYEYAYWAKDIYMYRMLQSHMDKNTEALKGIRINHLKNKGLIYQQQGQTFQTSHFDMTPLLTALREYDTLVKNGQTSLALKKIRNAQLNLPAHVANEYCRHDRSFAPTPNFCEQYLPREFTVDHLGRHLHFLSKFPSSQLKAYENSYIFVQNEKGEKMYFIPYGCNKWNCYEITFVNLGILQDWLLALKKKNETKVYLDVCSLKNILGANTDTWPHIRYPQSKSFFFYDSAYQGHSLAIIVIRGSNGARLLLNWESWDYSRAISCDLEALTALDKVRTAEFQKLDDNLVNEAHENDRSDEQLIKPPKDNLSFFRPMSNDRKLTPTIKEQVPEYN